MRHAALSAELEVCIAENGVRVVMLTSARGAGLTTALQSFVEELHGWGHRAAFVDCERVGVQAGGALDALLRSRLGVEAGVVGQPVSAALDTASPGLEPLSREFLHFAMGSSAPRDQISRLDPKSRWEGTIAEVSHWLESSSGSWVWVLDDAVAADAESLRLVEQLVQAGVPTPGLVVLAVRDDERALLEPKVRAMRATTRFREFALPPLSPEAFRAAFPGAVVSRAPVPLAARLMQLLGKEGAAPSSAETLARTLMEQAPAAEQRVLGLLVVAGGRLPSCALDAVLGPQAEVVRALEAHLLVRRGPTLRAREDEVWLRFPSATPAPDAQEGKRWLEAVGRWAEGVVFNPAAPLRPLALQQLIRAAEAAHDVARASFAWELSARLGGGVFALRKAEASATGTRRLVLGRLIGEDELFRGEVQRSIATAAATARGLTASQPAPPAWADVLVAHAPDELERWDLVTTDEGQLALELLRAESLSQLGQAGETRRAFEQVEQRLKRIAPSPVVSALWLRLARTWVWFAAEVLADGDLARRICQSARERVPDELIRASFHSLAFLRAEQVAHSRGGDPLRARALADELISVSRARGESKEECVAWNARGLLHYRDGELLLARAAFERSHDLARNIGFRRREAVALHNLGLVLAAGGEYGASLAAQERYVAISDQIGNLLARAYGPAAMAMVYVSQLEAVKAEASLVKARRAAEENGWPALVAWTRHLAGMLKLLRHLEQRDTLLLSLARSDFLACLDLVEDRKGAWSEEFDPAETAGLLVMTWLCAGNQAQAQAALPRAEKFAGGSADSARVAGAVRALVAGQPPTDAVAWFERQGHFRAAELWSRVARSLGHELTPSTGDVRAGL